MFRILEKEVEDKKNAWLWCPRSFLPKMYTGKIATYVQHIFRVTYVEHVKHMNCSQLNLCLKNMLNIRLKNMLILRRLKTYV